ncbi:ABC transporter permease [Tropicibacter sp. R15_0]|uniref:ABC transporter permease n=1 Tax=Tropicibacter sp. R15_0 TaxID=2821101 RepID=UPI001ADD560E|nr:ABC transporter permease [Tropicibacter sp. R15_0]MBO9468061.1 ABC transporter permease [Tropicibacter sp. R15_0]
MSQSDSLSAPARHEPSELREIHTRFATQRAVMALILREMSTTYGRSPGGYVWALLEPIAGIALLTAIFSAGFRDPPLGTNFPVFYASGLLPFMLYFDVANKLGQSIAFSRALLEYPRVTFVDALLARFLLNTMTQLMVNFVVMAGIFVIFDPTLTLDFGKITLAYAMAMALAFGVGTLNSFLILAYPVWQTIWSVMNRPIFMISCLFFLFESIPRPWSDYLWYNPLVHINGVMRDGFYSFYHPSYVSIAYPFVIGAVFAITGLFLLNRYHRDILDK